MSSPESKYPAQNEDIDTIITGTDGLDYIVDIVDGQKKWVLYLPNLNDEITIQKTLPVLENAKKEAPKVKREPNKYQKFLSETTTSLKQNRPELSASERKEIIKKLWKEKN
jgi:hypothetical protein